MSTNDKEVAKKKNNEVAAMADYGEDAGSGFETTDTSELSIPFLGILQSNSPQVEDEDPVGAKSGMFFNTVTRELISGTDGFVFLPVHKDRQYVEWVPREKGGGFVGMFAPDADEVKKAISNNNNNRYGKLAVGDNDLIETYYVYGLLLSEDGSETVGFGVISFTSTKIKPCRDWFTSMYTLKGRAPLFANRARFTTAKQKNDKGTFYNFRIDPLGDSWASSLINPTDQAELLEEARDFRKMIMSGMATANYDSEKSHEGNSNVDTETGEIF